MKLKLLFILIVLAGYVLTAQTDEWKFSGQLQLRSEFDERDFSNSTSPLSFTSMRTRLGVEKNILDNAGFFVQFQDSRMFGQEPNTLTPINNIDLHQGYIFLNDPFEIPLKLQAGRFEMIYGTERFFGAVGWHFVGRSFDGARVSINFRKNVKLDLFALTLSDLTSYIANAFPFQYPDPKIPRVKTFLYGAWYTHLLNDMHRFDVFTYYDLNVNMRQPEQDLDQFTAGLNHFGNYGSFSTIFEGAYQFGTRGFGTTGTRDIGAYLISLQLNYTTGITKFGIGADILSGKEPGAVEFNTFQAAYGTNHKFYGFMDYFINIPSNTSNLGLHDFYASASIQPKDSKFSGSLVLHHFMSNQDHPDSDIDAVFGQEVDLTIKFDFIKGIAIIGGGSLFLPGDLMKYALRILRQTREDPAFWTYLMITANF